MAPKTVITAKYGVTEIFGMSSESLHYHNVNHTALIWKKLARTVNFLKMDTTVRLLDTSGGHLSERVISGWQVEFQTLFMLENSLRWSVRTSQ